MFDMHVKIYMKNFDEIYILLLLYFPDGLLIIFLTLHLINVVYV